MNRIEKNEVTLLSHIIYTIYNTDELDQMRSEFLRLLKYAIPFDTANFFLVDTDAENRQTLTALINENSLRNPDVSDVLDRYMKDCFEIDSTHWLCTTNKPATYRLTDLLSEDALEASDYYKEMFIPFDLHYGAYVLIAHDNICLGLLSLFRVRDNTNFTAKEMLFLDCINEHLSIRMYNTRILGKTHEQGPRIGSLQQYNLTPRECEILDLLLQGLTSEEIAGRLFIADNTLRRHTYNLFSKLGIQERWQLHYL